MTLGGNFSPSATSKIEGNLIPDTDDLRTLGDLTHRWANIFATNIEATTINGVAAGAGTFTGGTVTGATYFASGVPAFDVQCTFDVTADTAAVQAAINLARAGGHLGIVRLFGGASGCKLNGTTLDLTGGIAYTNWLVIEQYGVVFIYNSAIRLPMLTKWQGVRSAFGSGSFSQNANAAVGNGDSGNHSLFESGTIAGASQQQNVAIENVSIYGNQASCSIHLYAPIQNAIRNSYIDNRLGTSVCIDQAGFVGGTGFALTLWNVSLDTGITGTSSRVLSITDTGNVVIGGDQPNWIINGTIELINDGTVPSMYGFAFDNLSTEAMANGASLVTTSGTVQGLVMNHIHLSDNVGYAYIVNNASGTLGGFQINDVDGQTAIYDPTSGTVYQAAPSVIDANQLGGAVPVTASMPVGGRGGHMMGLQDDLRRNGSPIYVSSPNIVDKYLPADWASCTGTTTTGISDPFGGTNAVRYSSASAAGCNLYRHTESPPVVGEMWIGGVWAKATSSGGYRSTYNPVQFETSGGATVMKGFAPGTEFIDGANQAWNWIWFFQEVTSVSGASEIIMTATVENGTDTDFAFPVIQKFASGSISRTEAIQRALALGSFSNTCSAGDLCGPTGLVNAGTLGGKTFAAPAAIGTGTPAAVTSTTNTSALYASTANCADSAGAAACGAAPAGAFVVDAASTSTVVSTSAVTANSQIFVQIDASLGTRLGVTCNTQAGSVFNPRVTARTAGTSFTVTVDAGPTTNPLCLNYFIVN